MAQITTCRFGAIVDVTEIPADPAQHALDVGQVACGEENEQPVACRLEDMHPAAGGDDISSGAEGMVDAARGPMMVSVDREHAREPCT